MNILCRSTSIIFNKSPSYFSILRSSGNGLLSSRKLIPHIRNTNSLTSNKTLLDNTNVVKDVILFKYDNARFYKIVNFFAIVQYIFWSVLAFNFQSTLRDIPVDESKLSPTDPWYKKINLGERKYRVGLTAMSLLMGAGILSATWIFTLKSVKYLVLHKGGKAVTIVTYTPYGGNRLMKVDMSHISCQQTRDGSKVQLPLKVKNKWLHYMLDMRGEFRNAKLFDSTAGLYRGF